MGPSHTIESIQGAWGAIEAAPALRALFIESTPFCPWSCDKVQIRILDRNTAAAAHTLGTLAYGQEPRVIQALQALAWSCHHIAGKESLK